jgi:S-adenosylmethionine decarboxylase
MIVGTEWIIDVANCDAEKLRDLNLLRGAFDRIISDLDLKVIGEIHWHQFPLPGNGITGLALLTESHLACHTYPESNTATFNLYCCRARPEWNWEANLRSLLGAKTVKVAKVERGEDNAVEKAKTTTGGDLP